jgi:hypothetical protein
MKCDPEAAPGIIRRTAESNAFGMSLQSIYGETITEDGVLVFKTSGYESLEASLGSNSFVVTMLAIDVNRIFVTVRRAENGSSEAVETDVVLVAPLDHSLSLNYKVSTGISIGLGTAGLVISGLLLAFPPLAAWAAAAGISGAIGLGTRSLYRWSYRRYLRKGREALDGFIAAVQTAVRTG